MTQNGFVPLTAGAQETPGRTKSWAFLMILSLYLCLAFYRIDYQSLWVDEVLSLRDADPMSRLQDLSIWFGGHGPLYFTLLHFWGKMGTSEFVLRSLSVVLGALGLILFHNLARRVIHQHLSWMGALVLATSPFFIWYSQEVRYIMLMIVTALAFMLGFREVVRSNQRRWWVAYSILEVIALSSFVSNVFLPLVHGTYLLLLQRGLLKKWLLSQSVIGLLFIWWANDWKLTELDGYWRALYHSTQSLATDTEASGPDLGLSSGGNREFTLAALPYTLFSFSTGFSMGPSVRDLQLSRSLATLMPHVTTLTILGFLFGGLVISGVMYLWRRPEMRVFFLIWLTLPIGAVLAVSAATDMTYNVRYAASAFPAFTLILAAGIVGLRSSWLQYTFLALVLLVNGVSLANYYFDPHYAREDSRQAARYLESVAAPRDVIRVVGDATAIQHYYKGEPAIEHWGGEHNNDDLFVKGRSQELSKNHDCLWLVEIRPWQGTGTKVKTLLEKFYPVVRYQHFAGVNIYGYDLLKVNLH